MTPQALLAESIHPAAAKALEALGVTPVERLKVALPEDELIEKLKGVKLLGIRSRTKVTKATIEGAPGLYAIGSFGIGTNQIDLDAASAKGIPVFNAPFANSRSVAELTISAAVSLLRRMPEKNVEMRAGGWGKSAAGAYEARAKKLGIVGYGNIGSQVSVLASAMGMHVYYYDIEPKLAHGNARAVASLDELLELSDIVTLHTPSTPATRGMIDAGALAKMKKGANIINYARGDLIDIDALSEALGSGQVGGAAIDVFPVEPASKDEAFDSPLLAHKNVLFSPHIGGSTQEAQEAIGAEVADKLARFLTEGATAHSVNFPQILPSSRKPGVTRILHAHQNVTGVLRGINDAVSDAGLNTAAQSLATRDGIGYVIADVEGAATDSLRADLEKVDGTIWTRIIE